MTQITRLFLRGFKSFAKPTELVFGNKYNCILGPNGSGKSNIGDAICFVLGKTSSKSMRAEKAANLIYNGGKVKRPAKEAEVAIYFENRERKFPVEVDEVKVSRIVNAKGLSKYFINDVKTTRTEVVNLLGFAHIDPDGHNIILQGDIVRFVEMSAEDRRKVMEEVAGIGVYEDRKKKATNELERVEQRINDADLILKEREASLKELKKDRDDALKYKDLSEKIKRNKASYLHKQISEKKKGLEKVNAELAKYKEQYAEFDKKIDEQKTVISENRKAIEEINRELQVKGTKEQADLQKKIQQLNIDIATAKQKIENGNVQMKRIEERRQGLKKDQKEIQSKIKNSSIDKEAAEKQLQRRRDELTAIEERLQKFKSKHQLDKEGDIQSQVDELDKQVDTKQKEIDEYRQKQQEVLREKDKLEVQLSVIDEKIEKVVQLEKENKGQLQTLKEKKKEFKKATLELSKLLSEDSSLASQLKTARSRLFSAQEELSEARAQQTQVMEKLGGSAAVKAILKEKRNIKGIHGTVGQLAEVPSKYSMALEVAAGNKLKSIVVDNEDVAAQCIKFLKREQLGVATFLPMNKIRTKSLPSNGSSLKRQTGVHDFAANIVSHDPKYKKIFSYVFQDVLVVQSLSTAKSIGVGTIKMVTLEGDLVDTSGAMKGGHRDKKKLGGFSNRQISQRIENLEEQVADSQAVQGKLEEKKNENEVHIVRLRELKANLEGDIITLEKTLHLEGGDLDASQKLKKEIEKTIEKLDTDAEEVSETIREINMDFARIKSQKEQLRLRITQLKSPTTLAELTAFEDKRQELRERIVQLETELKRIIGEQETIFLQEEQKLGKILAQLDKEEEHFSNQRDELKETVKRLSGELSSTQDTQKKFFVAFKQYYQRRDKLNTEITSAEKKLASLFDKVRDMDQRQGKITNSKVALETECAALEREFVEFEGEDLKLDTSKSLEVLKREIYNWEQSISRMGNINLKALEVYERIHEEFEKLVEKKETLRSEREDVLVLINEIESKKKELFMKTYDAVHGRFQEIFAELNTKGKVQLVIENQESPFEGGLFIRVKLSGKKYLDIRSLSGGEKTMTALAFIFAIQEYEPASFYILDEVDAALDKHNSERFANLIRQYCTRAQYLIVSHNDAVIGEADRMYGISMNEHGISKVTSLKFEDVQALEPELTVAAQAQ